MRSLRSITSLAGGAWRRLAAAIVDGNTRPTGVTGTESAAASIRFHEALVALAGVPGWTASSAVCSPSSGWPTPT